jgi:hypothetical protein
MLPRKLRFKKHGGGSVGSSNNPPSDGSVSRPRPRSSLKNAFPEATRRRRAAGKSVRFQQVQVREYERIIGDNPSCSSGVPIG